MPTGTPQLVRITDVAPRDGLQNEPGSISVSDKVELVRRLVASGVDEVEVSSFVPRAWVPQLGDAAEVFAALASDAPGPLLSALVPNERGMHAALGVNERAGRKLIGKVSVFTAASEAFSLKNTNASIAQTLERFVPVIALARAHGLLVRGYISCVIACPFAGPTAPAQVADVARRLGELGVDEIDLGDTIGAGTPESTRAMLETYIRAMGDAWLTGFRTTLHPHDTFARAGSCVRAAMEMGVRSFDGSAAGLGGCPYASTPGNRAPGNIATETLVDVVEHAGFRTRVDRTKLGAAAAHARLIVARSRTDGVPG